MKSIKISIQGQEPHTISARLELPADRKPHSYALFAHCFTCSKDFKAVHNISMALTTHGFGVLRFDFTGLGESAGNFSETSFSSNIDDIITVCRYMSEHYKAPSLVIGHSLGGAAAVVAGSKIDSIKAIVTIGAPSTATHVKHLFTGHVSDINSKGAAEVNIGGRHFTITKQFLEDLEQNDVLQTVRELRKPILIAHSPQDRVVDVENAAALFKAAHHPKSFLSLDGADHLLTQKKDSTYVGNVLSSWASRYLNISPPKTYTTDLQVVAHLTQDEGYTTQIQAGEHNLIADEPTEYGGNDFGPSPYELLSAGLGACTAMTIKMYAARKQWPLQEVYVHLSHSKDYDTDMQDTNRQSTGGKIDKFVREIQLVGPLDETQRQRLLEIANKCPVHKTLLSQMVIETRLQKEEV